MRDETPELDERIIYKSREEFIADLRKLGQPEDWIANRLEHEDAHAKVARELGYNPKYMIGIREDAGYVKTIIPAIHIDESIPIRDMIKMLRAPRVLSPHDKRKLAELKAEEEGR